MATMLHCNRGRVKRWMRARGSGGVADVGILPLEGGMGATSFAHHPTVTPDLIRGPAPSLALAKKSGMPGQARHDEGGMAMNDQSRPFIRFFPKIESGHS